MTTHELIRTAGTVSLIKLLVIILTVAAISMLGSCASMSESDCLYADWRSVGLADGRMGKPMTVLSDYRRDCSKHGVSPVEDEYREGRTEGLTFYCTRNNGYTVGRSGSRYIGVCPVALEPGFLGGFEPGKSVYGAVNIVETAENELREARSTVSSLKRQIQDLETSLDSDDLTKEESERRQQEIKNNYREMGQAEGLIKQFKAARIVAVAQYIKVVRDVQNQGFFEPFQF